jgi:hypothetical protein
MTTIERVLDLILLFGSTALFCGAGPLAATVVLLKLRPASNPSAVLAISVLLVPAMAVVLTGYASYPTDHEALQSLEDSYQLLMFTWFLVGCYFVVVGLPLGLAAGKIARHWVRK